MDGSLVLTYHLFMSLPMVRRLNLSLAVGLGFLGVVAAVAVVTRDRPLEASLIGALLVIAVAATWVLRRAVVRDLEAREAAEAKLRDSEAHFAGILAIAADAIITTDESTRIIHFNHAAESMFGYAAADVIGQPLSMLLPPAVAAVHTQHMANFGRSTDTARHKDIRRQVAGRRRNGEEFPAEASISKLTTAEGLLFTAVVRDVTDQQRLAHHEHTLAVAGARLAATLDYEATLRLVVELPVLAAGDWCLLDLIEFDDGDGDGEVPVLRRIASSHSNAGRHHALRSIEARGLDWDSPSDAIDVMRTGEARLHTTLSADWIEAHAIDASELEDIRQLGVRSCVTLPLWARERVIGTLTVGTSERPLLPADVDLARALAERGALAIDTALLYRRAQRAIAGRDQVLAIVSHDLRTPATTIAMCARTLLEHPPALPEERQALYSTIIESSNWMHRLMQDLLDAASVDAGRLAVDAQPRAVAPMVAAAAALFAQPAQTADVMLHIRMPPGLPDVQADDARVLQLLGNLLANALRFTPGGGCVTIRAEAGPGGVVLSVSDTGVGIEADQLAHVFDRFWQVSSAGGVRGTGLGLAIAKGIVDAHRGRIWVESEVGRGSTFFVELPLA